MIEKIKNKTDTYCGQTLPVSQDTIINKINELVDVVNKQDKAIRLLINGLECFVKGQQLMNTEIEIKG